jgi:hypothetical protein
MRLGYSIRIFGPIRLSGTLWRSKRRRRKGYHGTLPGWSAVTITAGPNLPRRALREKPGDELHSAAMTAAGHSIVA